MRVATLLTTLLPLGGLAIPLSETIESSTEPVARRDGLTDFLRLIFNIFPLNEALEEVSDHITVAAQSLADTLGYSTTRDELSGGACSDLILLFARGTTEPGNVGALVGPPLFEAVRNYLPASVSLAVQGVDYPADVQGFLSGGGEEGAVKW
jgi:cutinase